LLTKIDSLLSSVVTTVNLCQIKPNTTPTKAPKTLNNMSPKNSKHAIMEEIILENVKEHAPSPAGAGVETGGKG
jgi:hypothetical protein